MAKKTALLPDNPPETSVELPPFCSLKAVENAFESAFGIYDQKKKKETPIEFAPNEGPQSLAYLDIADVIGYGGAAGGGKMLDIETPVPTPGGWTTMGELQDGDLIFDESGRICSVVKAHPVNERAVGYRLVFDDGSTVDACEDHLWLTYDANDLTALTRLDPEWRARRQAKRPSRAKGTRSADFTAGLAAMNAEREYKYKPAPTGSIRTTREIAETLRTSRGRTNHAIPVTAPLELPEIDLPLDPYCLGAWLGDGSKSSGGFTSIDPPIWQEFEKCGFTVTHSKSEAKEHRVLGMIPILKELGVYRDKHIPEAYLRASREQRLALLQGLMDTDGTVNPALSVSFCNTNRRIIDGVHELICSLGWKASIREYRAKLYGKDCGAAYTIKWTPSDYVFRLPRKRDKQKLATRRTTKFRYIVDCVPIEPKPMRCITVDSPSHLYLFGKSFIPTHNTFLALGLALTKHRDSIIFRRESTQLTNIIKDSHKLIGDRGDFNENKGIWRNLPEKRRLQMAGVAEESDVDKWKGQPHDLKIFDEATEFTESQVRFLTAWTRSPIKTQKCTVLLCFNPPTTVDGEWVIKFFAPWLDEEYSGTPAEPGELRYFAMVGEEEREMPDKRKFVVQKGEVVYDFNPDDYDPKHIITPKSRTFIRAALDDNPYYGEDYLATLQGLPFEMREAMLHGVFKKRGDDNPWQSIPADHVRAAQKRWETNASEPLIDSKLVASGLDVSRGGKDKTVWTSVYSGKRKSKDGLLYDVLRFEEQKVWPGEICVDGDTVASFVMPFFRPGSVVNVDVVGVGASAYDCLKRMLNTEGEPPSVLPVNNGQPSPKDPSKRDRLGKQVLATDKSGKLTFVNVRAYGVWKLRELLDPQSEIKVELPPSKDLRSDLCTPTYRVQSGKIYVESKEDVKKRLPDRRSTDFGDSAILAVANLGPGRVKRKIPIS